MKNLRLLTSRCCFFRFFSTKNLISAVCVTGIFIMYSQTAWSQANTELSNLVAPTKVNVNLQPTNDNSKNLGSDSKSWKDFYLDGYLYLDGARFISNVGGLSNVLVGNQAGNITMTGAYNSAFGDNTLVSNTIGNYNSAFGNNSLADNTTGDYNSAFGRSALSDNITGDYNAAFGYTALTFNTSGYSNSAFGADALHYSTTGVHNSAFGKNALYENTSGDYNSACGSGALHDNTTGDYNSAFGEGALYFSTTGSYNSAFGNDALNDNTTGSENAAFGREALSNNTTGIKNVAVGNQAGIANTSGDFGTFLGYDAGGNNTIGSQNTYLGYSAEGSNSTFNNVVGVGYQVTNTAGNQARIGNSSTTSIGGWAGWSNVSDGRFKKNVKEEVAGLAFINKLRPVIYTLDLHAADAFIGKEFTADDETEESAKISEQAKNAKEKIIYSGFIAQEVETAAREIGYDFSGVDAPKNEKDLYGLRYAEFVVPIVKSIQELSDLIAQKDVKIDDQQKQIDELKNQVTQLVSPKSTMSDGFVKLGTLNTKAETPLLGQNIPNPFDYSTSIPFRIPKDCNSASIVISELNGRVVAAIPITCNETHVAIEAGNLTAGNYAYTLYVDGNQVDSKQMVIVK